MIYAHTLARYIGRRFCLAVAGTLGALTLLVALFDIIELLRRAASEPQASLAIISEIEGLRLPYIGMQILPFAVLLGGILAFWRLTRSSELIVARAAGLSAWEFLSAPVACALLMGAGATMLVSPLSSVMLARAEQLDTAYLRSQNATVEMANNQLWLRQADHTLQPGGVAFVHVQKLAMHDGALTGRDVSVFRVGADDRLLQRIEAPSIALADGAWLLADARVITPDHLPQAAQPVRLPTDLSIARVQQSFAPPDTLSFWDLPGFIGLLQRSGFSSVRHRLYFQSLLALPLLAGTMALVAAGFSMRPARRGGTAQMIASGVAAGFVLYLLSKIAQQFGDSGVLPTALAAWAPAVAGMMLALTLLLHLEDG